MSGTLTLAVRLLALGACLFGAVLSAPTTTGSESTTVETTTEELDFKDVPIYPKDKPGVKYVAVMRCRHNRTAGGVEGVAPPAKDVPHGGPLHVDQQENVGQFLVPVNEPEEKHQRPSSSVLVAEVTQILDNVRAAVAASHGPDGSVIQQVPELTISQDGDVESTTLSNQALKDQGEDGILATPAADSVTMVELVQDHLQATDSESKTPDNDAQVIETSAQNDVGAVSPVEGSNAVDEASEPEEETATISDQLHIIEATEPVSADKTKVSIPSDEAMHPVVLLDTERVDDESTIEMSTEDTATESAPKDQKDVVELNAEIDESITQVDLDEKKNYAGYKVYRVTVPTEEAAKWILKFEDLPGIEFWADPKLLLRPRGFFVTSAADILVAPDVTEYLEEAFRQARLPFDILINDVQDAIRNENPVDPLDEELMERVGHRMTWERYHDIEDIDSYLDYLNMTYPKFVTVEEIGRSSEGRPIRIVKLHQPGGVPNKKTIFIDAGIHAREWITPATITYMIKELVENPDRYNCIMEQFDWHFLPLVNPDGYTYSHKSNRMWRKTRSQPDNIAFRNTLVESLRMERISRFQDDPILDDSILEKLRSKVMTSDRASFSCTGADANRNFDYQWLSGGSSRNPCVDTYAGSKPFSEPEAQALADYVMINKDDIAMYISLHAYSQMWLIPWGYTEEKPADFSDLYSLAKTGANALERVHGADYLIGTIPDLLYIASGSSIDWIKAVAGVKYAYTLELRDAGRYGFLLPAKQILPTGEETLRGIYASAAELAGRIYQDTATCPPPTNT